MLPSLSHLVIQHVDIGSDSPGSKRQRVEEKSDDDCVEEWPSTDELFGVMDAQCDLASGEGSSGSGGGGGGVPAHSNIHCGDVESLDVFHANVFSLNPKDPRVVAGGRMQMPGMTLSKNLHTITCPGGRSSISLKIATLQTHLAYSNEQLLFHASTDPILRDDGHFRYFAFDVSHAATYAWEESTRQESEEAYMHVFRVKTAIPNLAFFADSETWADMSGRTTI